MPRSHSALPADLWPFAWSTFRPTGKLPTIVRRNQFDLDNLPIVTTLTIIWCVVVFLGVNLQHGDLALARWGFVSEDAIDKGAYWGLITTAFVHEAPFHLLFNLYWVWYLGSAFERTFGSIQLLLLILTSAFVSSGLQLFAGAGIGLSGVGYALFGFGWVARKRYPAFARIVNDTTVLLFVGWGILCVITTYLHVMNVGNVAHLSGALFGAAVAGMVLHPRLRIPLALALVLMSVGSVVPIYLHRQSDQAIERIAAQAEAAENKGDYPKAIQLFRQALQQNGINPAYPWEHLTLIYYELGDDKGYRDALEHLRNLDPEEAQQLESDLRKAEQSDSNSTGGAIGSEPKGSATGVK